MKKIVSSIILFFGISLFSFNAIADASLMLEGKGSTMDAVTAFNKAVTSIGGTVDGNSVTESSSTGDFGKYQAKMDAETNGEKVSISIIINSKNQDLLSAFLGAESNEQLNIVKKINENMKKAGYHN